MKIDKYKKRTNGKYSVYLEDGREFVLYEDIILKYELLIHKEIKEELIDDILQNNLETDVYYIALNSLKSRYRSIYELKEYLRKKEYPLQYIDNAVDKLISQGYLNDQVYAKSYINTQIITTNHGPNRIKNDLINKKIDSNIIEEELVCFTEEEQINKMDKIISYRIKTNRNKAGVVLKKKIYNDLVLLGYDTSYIQKALNHFKFSNDNNLQKKEYEKLYKKYSRKYSGYELDRIIKDKLYQKGFHYEEE